MKKIICVLLLCMLFFGIIAKANFNIFNENGLRCLVPTGWTENTDDNTLEATTYTYGDEAMIQFYTKDLWEAVPDEVKEGAKRSDIDNSIFSKEDIADIIAVEGFEAESITMETFGEKEYFCAYVPLSGATEENASVTFMIHCENGYIYMISFFGNKYGDRYADFVEMLEGSLYTNTSYSPGSKLDKSNIKGFKSEPDFVWTYFAVTLLISAVVTIGIYTVPIVIYRYAIKKTTVERKKALLITVIYGIVAYIIMAIINYVIDGSAAGLSPCVIWSSVNYGILRGKKKKEEPLPEQPFDGEFPENNMF
ncbi:MAG: hypothetical protein Q4G23_07295 [Clostridia bacterium]|nr:hypothetical protein [Clostridia bacterium]